MMILDEADKLLSIDFQPIIEKILSFFPKDRQVMLFSATFPMSIKNFIDTFLGNYDIINLMDELTLIGLTQYYVYLEEK